MFRIRKNIPQKEQRVVVSRLLSGVVRGVGFVDGNECVCSVVCVCLCFCFFVMRRVWSDDHTYARRTYPPRIGLYAAYRTKISKKPVFFSKIFEFFNLIRRV